MHMLLDVVDLMQLQEVWSWRPIVVAFSRLERRETPTGAGGLRFDLAELTPRLTRLRRSPDWQQKAADPARVPIRDLSEDDFSLLYPGTDAAQARQFLFDSAYHSFVVARYRGPVEATVSLLRSLARARQAETGDYLDQHGLPQSGSPDWIPADITDEIRGLDTRYNAAEPGTPAAYVIADSFWSLPVKANAAALDTEPEPDDYNQHQRLITLIEVARTWNRSPSVVGLCYQIESEDEEA